MPHPALIIINGRPASGKTTLAKHMASQFFLPIIAKDGLKEQLFQTLGWHDRDWSRQVGKAASELIYYLADQLLSANNSLIIESNFDAKFASEPLTHLINHYQAQALQIFCQTQPDVLLQRFQKRAASLDRHPGHTDITNFHEITHSLEQPFDPLNLPARLIHLNTTNPQNLNLTPVTQAIQSILPTNTPITESVQR